MPAIHSASIATNLLGALGGATVVGPMLLGLQKSVQIASFGASVGDIVTLPPSQLMMWTEFASSSSRLCYSLIYWLIGYFPICFHIANKERQDDCRYAERT